VGRDDTGADPAPVSPCGLLDSAARGRPRAPAVLAGGTVLTFAGLRARATALAAGLRSIGSPGDRVALLSENRVEVVEAYYGVPAAGMVLAPLNHRLHAEEWCEALCRLEPAVLVGEGPLLDRLTDHPGADAVLAAAGTAVHELVVEGAGPPRRSRYEELSTAGPPGSRPLPVPAPTDPAWLIATSGTTGTPKHAVLTHASLLAAARSTAAARDVRTGDVLLTPFPLCHVAGYNVLVHHLRGCPVVLMRRFDPAELLELVREHGVTTLSLAPTMIAMLLDHLDALGDPGSPGEAGRHPAVPASLRAVGYGASPIHADLLRRALVALDCDVSQGYGMTELSGNAVFLGPQAHRRAAAGDARLLGAAGWPAPGVELRIVDGAGRDRPAGVVGEILVRAAQVAAGYWRDPAATAEVFGDGWLRTGDAGRLGPDGLLHVVDRIKDVVVSGGENVASREVEDVLRRHPSVDDVAVVGIPDARWGERVCAVVVAAPGATVDAAGIEALARRHLAGYKVPRRVVVVDELPRNSTGKVLKARLRDAIAGASGGGRRGATPE